MTPTIYYNFMRYQYAFQTLRDGRFKITQPSAFNDPFDFNPVFLPKPPPSIHPDKIAEARVHTDRIADSFAVLPLSTARDEMLMWSHYGDQHRGVALGISNLNATPPHKVNYDAARPIVDFSQPPSEFLNQYGKACIAKSDKWRYENEYRYVFKLIGDKTTPGIIEQKQPDGSNLYFYPFPPDCLVEVVFGARCPTLLQDILKRLLDDHYSITTRITYAKMDEDSFDLRFLQHMSFGVPLLSWLALDLRLGLFGLQ